MNNKYISKVITILFLLWLSCSYFLAQNYQITYEVKFKPVKENNTLVKENMILKIIKDQSTFFNSNKAKIDSLVNQNNFKAAKSVANPLLRFKVSKTLSKREYLIGGNFNQFNYWYKQQPLKFNHLKKVDSYKNYTTHEAFTDFGQRKWHILYTTDIPINDGPYVFSGLPGFVIKAESLDGDYTFELIEVKKIDITEEIVKAKENISKEKLSSIISDFIKDPASQRINLRNDMGDGFTYEFNGAKDKNYKDTNEYVKNIIEKFNNYPDKEIPVITF